MPHNQNEPLSLSYISACGLCKSEAIKVALSGVEDNVSYSVDYSGDILECLDCGHAFLSPVINAQHLHLAYQGYYTQNRENIAVASNAKRDLFSIFKEFYNYRFRGLSSKRGILIWFISSFIPFSRFFLARAVRFLTIPPASSNLSLLDVGCGRGDFLIRSRHCGYISTGIDFDPETIDIARSRGLDAYVSEIHDLPEAVKYDAITLSHVIEHVRDPVALLNDIYIRLKPGGYFYIATPNFDSAGRLTFGKDWRGCDVPRHMHFFNIQTLKKLLIKTGFIETVQVYDLPQSIGVIRSSFGLKYPDGFSLFKLAKSSISLFRNRFYSPRNLEVAVIKCHKPI